MSKIRKAFVVSIMMMTVLSMSVVVAPQAEAASAGDLIKMNGLSSVYFLGADGKRYVFPNESTYFSWYSDFSGVVTISQSELESYPLGKNVTVRPGTKMVKITTDPKVYAVEPNGNLVWVPSEAVAATLYGADWAKRIVDVPDSFFMSYTVTGAQVSDTAYPAGSLVKYAEDATVYWIGTDGKAYPFASEAAFMANRFKWSDVLNATIDKPATGDPITGAIAAVIDTSSGAGGQAGAGTGLTVSLSGDTPGSVNIPSNSTLVPFLAVNLTASNDGAVTVQQLSFTRRGTGPTADFAGGYLFVGDERLSNRRTVNSDNTITFSALNLNIPAGGTKTVMLKMNAGSAKSGNHYFQLTSAAAVSTNGAVVSGAFPIEGNLMSYATVNAATVTVTADMGDVERKVGESNVVLQEFSIQNDGQEEVKVYSVRLRNNGSASNAAVNNLSLDIDGTVVVTGKSMVGGYVNFVLAAPFTVKKSETLPVVVRGDVVADVNKTVELYLSDVGDIDVRGTAYGDFYSATIAGGSTMLVTSSTGAVAIKGSEINVSFDGPQAADVKADTKNVVFANFLIKSESEDVEINTIRVNITGSSTAALENFELVDKTNNITYGADTAPAGTGDTINENITFSNIVLMAGTQYRFEIQGDIPDGVPATNNFTVALNLSEAGGHFRAKYVQSNADVQDEDLSSLSLTGKRMTVASPFLAVDRVLTNNITTVKDAKGVLLYKGKMTATAVDDIRVTRVGIDGTFGHGASNFAADWARLYLYKVESNGTETLLNSQTSLSSTAINFTGFTTTVTKGLNNSSDFVIRGDVKSNPVGTSTQIKLNSNWTVRDTNNNTVSANLDTSNYGSLVVVVNKGSIAIEVNTEEAGVNIDKNVLAGTKSLIGRLKLTASNEVAVLDDLVLTNHGTATNGTLGQVCLYEDKEMTDLVQCVNVDGNKRALFQSLNFEVPTAGVTYLYIAGMIKGIDYSANPGSDATGAANQAIQLFVPQDAASTYKFKATGKSTGELLVSPFASASSTAWTRQATVMGAIVSGLSTSFANGALTAGTAKDIFSFKVTVPASSNKDFDGTDLGAILDAVNFTVSTSSYSISNIRVERVGGANGEKTSAAAPTSNAFTVNFGTVYGTDTDRIVRPGDTAEFVIRADVAGTADSGSIQVTIEAVDSNVTYTHRTGTNGVLGSNATAVAPKLSGVTAVRGGTLSK